MAGDMLYTPTIHHTIVALRPESGEGIWKYDLGKASGTLRGVTYWPGDKENPPRVMAGTSDGHLIALNAETGKLVPGFGDNGAVNLRDGVTDKFPKMPYHMSSPGAIYGNLIITGAQGQEENPDGPAMDVRAWDVRTGKLVWTFHTIPHPGEPGYETWPKDNWITAGSPAPWGAATVDAKRGLIFLPIGQPASQYYGGAREGQNLYSSSIVALDANDWQAALVFPDHASRHVGLRCGSSADDDGRDAQRQKNSGGGGHFEAGLMFFLDRDTGKSVYPVEERAVPQSERSWRTFLGHAAVSSEAAAAGAAGHDSG